MKDHLTSALAQLNGSADWNKRTGGTLPAKLTCFEAQDVLIALQELQARAERAEAELKRYTDAVNAQPWATDEPIRVLLDRVTMLWASEKQAKIERGDMLCGCQDQLRAERDWLKTWQDQAETNYVIGEPLAKKLRDTEAERDELRGALALGQQNCDDVFEDLRNERDQLRADCNNLRADLDAIKAIRNEETARAERAEAKVSNQAERIRYLEGATNHATGTPLSIAIARAERAGADLATAKAIIASIEEDGTEEHNAAVRLRQELATERARLDWLECNAGDIPRYHSRSWIWISHQNLREKIDAAMKEGA